MVVMIEKLELDFSDIDNPVHKQFEKKINELIDAHNDHFHHARELQFGTETPKYVERIKDNEYIRPE